MPRDAGADDGIEVTPEMIEAGVDALFRYESSEVFESPRGVVSEIYAAIESAGPRSPVAVGESRR